MRLLSIYIDGTGNTESAGLAGKKTHIRRVYDLVALENNDDRCVRGAVATRESSAHTNCALYIEGINGVIRAVRGRGVLARVNIALNWLARTYWPGDRIMLSGFSRGAASALLLAHYINDFGAVTPADRRYDVAKWVAHRTAMGDGFHEAAEAKGWMIANDGGVKETPVARLFLIDTVFSSIECGASVSDWVGNVTGIAENVAHAVARHETRKPFLQLRMGTSRTRPATRRLSEEDSFGLNIVTRDGRGRVSQSVLAATTQRENLTAVAFDGSHSDIAGLYSDTVLAKDTLHWFLKETAEFGVRYSVKEAARHMSGLRQVILRKETGNAGYFTLLSPLWRLAGSVERYAGSVNHSTSNTGVMSGIYVEPVDIEYRYSMLFLVPKDAVRSRLRLGEPIVRDRSGARGYFDFSNLKSSTLIEWKVGMDISTFPNHLLCSYIKVPDTYRSGGWRPPSEPRQTSAGSVAPRTEPRRDAHLEQITREVQRYEATPSRQRFARSYLYQGGYGDAMLSPDVFAAHNERLIVELLRDISLDNTAGPLTRVRSDFIRRCMVAAGVLQPGEPGCSEVPPRPSFCER